MSQICLTGMTHRRKAVKPPASALHRGETICYRDLLGVLRAIEPKQRNSRIDDDDVIACRSWNSFFKDNQDNRNALVETRFYSRQRVGLVFPFLIAYKVREIFTKNETYSGSNDMVCGGVPL